MRHRMASVEMASQQEKAELEKQALQQKLQQAELERQRAEMELRTAALQLGRKTLAVAMANEEVNAASPVASPNTTAS